MMKIMPIITLLIFFCCSQNPTIKNDNSLNSETKKFHSLLDHEWKKNVEEYPEWATQLGDNRFNDKLNDASYGKVIQRQNKTRKLLERIKDIDRSALSVEDQLNYDLFLNDVIHGIAGFEFLSYLIPISQMGGLQISFAGISNYMPFKTIKDHENYIARMKAFPKKIDQVIDRMKRGLEAGWIPPKIVLDAVPEQIKTQFDDPVEESPLFKPFIDLDRSISADEQNRLINGLKTVLQEDVFPAYRLLYDFFVEDYLPNCRESIACKDFPNGDSYYQYLIKGYTTTDLTAKEIHDIGIKEVSRIKLEMKDVIALSNFKGSFEEFLIFLRTSPEFYFETEDELLDAYRAICKRADAQLPRFFGRLPRLPYGVKAIPDYQAPASPTAYYYSGSHKAGRSGYFMANTFKLETRPKYEMEALSVHEAVPGHHLQISLAQELEDVPMFRRYGGYTAFVEGWGLYSEKLAEEMGFYDDPYSKFGQLTYEMWRACRLVVDTGMHSLGWTREEAINYMSRNTAKTGNDIEVEIDRYIAWPGQALAYKIGELRILDLRKKAEEKLGQNFNIRDFHDVVLGDGAVPLDVLEKHVNQYINSNAN